MSPDRVLTTHIGSLPRVPDLLDLLKRKQSGEDVDGDIWRQPVRDATESRARGLPKSALSCSRRFYP